MNLTNMLLSVSPALTIILSIIMLAIGGGAGFGITSVVVNKKTKSARANADKILEDARLQAEKIKKDQVELLFSKESTDEDFKECPVCLELVRSKAKICRYCGHKF